MQSACQQVRCHENLNISISMCVCIVRDGVQMVLPVGSHTKIFTSVGLPEHRTNNY